MDLRDNTHDQLVTLVGTLRKLAEIDSFGEDHVRELRRVLEENALHVELFIIPKVPAEKLLLNLKELPPEAKTEPQIAQYVPATSQEALDADEAPSFLRNGSAVKA